MFKILATIGLLIVRISDCYNRIILHPSLNQVCSRLHQGSHRLEKYLNLKGFLE